MSRNFKFRAWNKASKEMVDFTFEDLKASDSDEDILLPNEHRLLEHTIIMQYLGADCKDKNGIELCEGDVIMNPDTYKKGKIIYETGNFKIEGYGLCNWWHAQIKIGNIYQNPELLEIK